MPKVLFGRSVSEALDGDAWVSDLSSIIESKRYKNRPTYLDIANTLGISEATFYSRMKTGKFKVMEFRKLAQMLHFTDSEILKLLKGI